MKSRILYDNIAEEGFRSGWGFSCLIGEHVLFDVGADLNTLLFNMRKASVELDEIDKVVLSHEHHDLVGGIQVLSMRKNVKVFTPCSFSNHFKRKISMLGEVTSVEVDEPIEISEGLYLTGVLGYFIREQSLIVETEKGLTVVTGCSHPGLEKILNHASALGKLYGVVGGFHGFSKLQSLVGLSLIAPCHCTRKKKEIHERFPETSVRCYAGCSFEV